LPPCPDLEPSGAHEFLPNPEGSCFNDYSDFLPYYANACIGNTGDAAAGPFQVETHSIYDQAASRFTTLSLPGLAAGAQLCRLVPHPYSDLVVSVDTTNTIPEADEANNSRSFPLALPTAPPRCTASPTPTRSPPAD